MRRRSGYRHGEPRGGDDLAATSSATTATAAAAAAAAAAATPPHPWRPFCGTTPAWPSGCSDARGGRGALRSRRWGGALRQRARREALRRSPWLVDALKNLRWAAQSARGARAEQLKDAVKKAVTSLRPSDSRTRPAILSSLALDVSLGALVCARAGSPGGDHGHSSGGGGGGGDTAARLYIDHVKRSVSYFIGGDIPHRLFPAVGASNEVVFDIQCKVALYPTPEGN